jgi:hypothetical protein
MELHENASFPRTDNRELDSNVADSNELHHVKHDSQIISTDPGMRIERNPLEEDALSSRRDNRDCASNVTNMGDLSWKKHDSEMSSTDLEM